MLRLLVALLLIANALFLIWSLGWLDRLTGIPADGDRDPQRLERQVDPQRITLIDAPTQAARSASAPAGPAPSSGQAASAASSIGTEATAVTPATSSPVNPPAPAPASAPVTAVPTAPTAPTAPASAPASPVRPPPAPAASIPAASLAIPQSIANAARCLEAGPYEASALASAEGLLRSTFRDLRWTRHGVPGPGEWTLYMGPYADDEALERKKSELARIRGGIPYQVIEAPAALARGISLGRFDSPAAGEQRLQQYRERGIRTARVVRSGNGEPRTVLRIDPAEPALADRLASLRWPAGRGFTACTDVR
jgi:hypothetical protein